MNNNQENSYDDMLVDVVVVGAGPAGIGVSAMLSHLGIENMVILEKKEVGSSFKKWPKEMQLITPSFTTNFFGQMDINSVISGTSPAFSLQTEHPSGKDYAIYLKAISEFCNLPIIEGTNVKSVTREDGLFKLLVNDGKELKEGGCVA